MIRATPQASPSRPTTISMRRRSRRCRCRIALMPNAFDDRAAEEMRSAVAAAVARLADAGARIETVEQPPTFAYIAANTMLELTAEAAEVHRERFAEKKDLYGPKIREFVERGLDTPAWEYMRAREVQSRFRREVDHVLARFDAILTPATPAAAPAGIASTGDPSFNLPWSLERSSGDRVALRARPFGIADIDSAHRRGARGGPAAERRAMVRRSPGFRGAAARGAALTGSLFSRRIGNSSQAIAARAERIRYFSARIEKPRSL